MGCCERYDSAISHFFWLLSRPMQIGPQFFFFFSAQPNEGITAPSAPSPTVTWRLSDGPHITSHLRLKPSPPVVQLEEGVEAAWENVSHSNPHNGRPKTHISLAGLGGPALLLWAPFGPTPPGSSVQVETSHQAETVRGGAVHQPHHSDHTSFPHTSFIGKACRWLGKSCFFSCSVFRFDPACWFSYLLTIPHTPFAFGLVCTNKNFDTFRMGCPPSLMGSTGEMNGHG